MYTELSAFSDNNRRMAVELGLTDWPVFIIACQNDVSPDTKTMFIKPDSAPLQVAGNNYNCRVKNAQQFQGSAFGRPKKAYR